MFTLWASVLVTYRWAAPFDCATECFRTDDVTGVVGAMESLPSLFWASVPAIENHPLVQTSTRAGLGFRAGVKDYRLTYFMDDYKVIDTDLLAAFRVVPQPGVPSRYSSSLSCWTNQGRWLCWEHQRYKGR